MKPFPHHYTTSAIGGASGAVVTSSRSCPSLLVAEPEEFNGTGEHWSPEQLFTAMVANCLILTFRAIAEASGFHWIELACKSEGVLERVEGVNRFMHINISATLLLTAGADEQKGLRLLTKAENQCLIKNSISAQTSFNNEIKVMG